MFQGWAKFVHKLVNNLGMGYILNKMVTWGIEKI